MRYYRGFLMIVLASLLISCRGTKEVVSTSGYASSADLALSSMLIDAKRESFAGNYSKAEELLKKCIEKNPSYSVAYYELSFIYLNRGELSNALKMAEKAYSQDSKNTWYGLQYAHLLERSRQYKQAVRVYKNLISLDNDNISFKHSLAQLYIQTNKTNEAIAVYNEIESLYGVSEDISLRKKRMYLEDGKTEQAILEVEKLIKTFPENFEYKGMLAGLYESIGRSDKAFMLYREMIALAPDNGLVNISLAAWYLRSGDRSKAMEQSVRAFQNDDADIDSKIALMLKYYALCHNTPTLIPDAHRLLEILIERNSNEPKVFAMQADFFLIEDKQTEARESFRKVIALDSLRFPIWENLLSINYRLDDYDALIDESGRALQLFPEQVQLYYYRAFALKEKQQYEEAQRTLRTGLLFSGRNPQWLIRFYELSGDIYMESGEREKAKQSYQKALELSPADEKILRKLNKL